MQKDSLESLLNKTKGLEKKYEWLHAAEFYQKTYVLISKKRNFQEIAELHEQTGFCFYRSAFQSQTNAVFRKRLKLAVRAFQSAKKLLGQVKQENVQAQSLHAEAFVAYVRSWLEADPLKKKKLLDDWWVLANKALGEYERTGNLHSIGKICNDLVEYSYYNRFWLVSDYTEHERVGSEALNLAERAISILTKLNDDYELTRAYCFASYFYSHGSSLHEELREDKEKLKEIARKCSFYSRKALELSEKTGDAWLISWAYLTAFHVVQIPGRNQGSAIEYGENALKYGRIAKDNFMVGYVSNNLSHVYGSTGAVMEDPDKRKELWEKGLKSAQKAVSILQIFNYIPGFAFLWQSLALSDLASIETNPRKKQCLIEESIRVAKKGIEHSQGWKRLVGPLSVTLHKSLLLLSETTSVIQEKRKLLEEALFHAQNWVTFQEKMVRSGMMRARAYHDLGLVTSKIARLEKDEAGKLRLFNAAIRSMEKCVKIKEKIESEEISPLMMGVFLGPFYYDFSEILQQIHLLTQKEKYLSRAIEALKKATAFFEKASLPTRAAESYWKTAQLGDQLSEYQEASQGYKLASEAYALAAENIPKLNQFYTENSKYMNAWSQIEQAKFAHSIEEYSEAKQNYEKAAMLHKSTDQWSYLAPNYSAWANMEEAESLSREENTQQAKNAFEKTLQQFIIAEESIKQKLEETTASHEKEMILTLLKASDLRCKYSQARILLEEAKLLDREGKYLQSSKSYAAAAKNISAIIEKTDVEAERKELGYLAVLCRAWEKMAVAEERTSFESYLEAAGLFEKAKEYCYTKKASLWVLGNSSFCRGLAAGVAYQTMLDVVDHNKAKGYIQNAATNYFKAGYKNASEYAKATLRLFDAYLFMNEAERESDTEKRVKRYQLAENLLELASVSFVEAQQPEKAAQVKQILESVREEKKLAISFNDVLQAPSIASSTRSFSFPKPRSEVSVGLESFEHANVQANLIVDMKEVKVGESFCLTVEFVNAGKEPALLVEVEDFVPLDFVVVEKPEIYRLEESCLNMKGKQIAPLKLVEAKLVLQPSKKGVYQLRPTIHYLDELGQDRSLQLKSVEIRVEEVVLADRVSTGTKELDSLLLGGIPREYAVVLAGPPSDERELIIRNFLEVGTKEGETSFYVTTEAIGVENLLEKSVFYLFLCNPKPKVDVPDLPNVYKLCGKTDLTNLNIALLKAYRSVVQSSTKRVCLEIISDILLRYGPEATRRWVSELITDMGSKGFTILAVVDPSMHPSDQANAILNLFDGEVSLYQTEDTLECKKSIRVRKLRNQDYIKNSICLTKHAV